VKSLVDALPPDPGTDPVLAQDLVNAGSERLRVLAGHVFQHQPTASSNASGLAMPLPAISAPNVHGFEYRSVRSDIGPGSHTKATYQAGELIGQDIAEQIGVTMTSNCQEGRIQMTIASSTQRRCSSS